MSDIVWEAPPQRGRYTGDKRLIEFADALRARPGEWAVWPKPLTHSSCSAVGTSVRNGSSKAFAGGGFETTVQTGDDGVRKLYVRFVGEAS